jgi:L-amino acid N-acyltransferase YncA
MGGFVMSLTFQINLREATEDDAQAIAEICESNVALYDPIMPGAFQKQSRKIRESGLPTTYDILVIEFNDKVVGFIGTIALNQECIYLVALYLHSDVQRQGIGQKVLKQLIIKFEKQNFKSVVLLVHQEATWAKTFYQKNGFQKISNDEKEIKAYKGGILKNYYIPSTILMRKKIIKLK